MVLYHYTPKTARVRQLRLILVPVRFRQVVISSCHVSTLSGHIHKQITLFMILERFWWTMVNKEVDNFITSCTRCQLVNSCSNEAHKILHTIESDTPYGVVFLDFWEPGDIPYWDGSCKIKTCLDCMTVFRLGLSSGLKEITSYQITRWDFGNLFFTFGLPKMVVVDADGIFLK